ncbi:hypothetical protein ES332_D03G012400v1 [Gossypium tomentosum]|uniref:Uncharacterized protein n=1 Tax=Gossypium tomentosum TaxID=34277 RepID=A0A5D2LH87_GOSTO|nr:hypothetical protein ES332_D03G012400v1 [Gossypium tomentosum]
MYPLDFVRTRFQVNDGPVTDCPTYKNTAHAIFTITRLKDSTLSLSLSFCFLCVAKQRYFRNREERLSPSLHLASAAEAGALVSICTNPIWLIRTRLELQNPLHQSRPYSGVYDTVRTILREEGWTALYTRLGPGLLMQVSHGAIQFTAYEELRRIIMVDYEERKKKPKGASNLLLMYKLVTGSMPAFVYMYYVPVNFDVKNSFDYAVLGGSSKIAAILVTYPFQHVVKETARFEGFHGFYKGINPNLLRHVPASSITLIVYENVLKFLKSTKSNDWEKKFDAVLSFLYVLPLFTI